MSIKGGNLMLSNYHEIFKTVIKAYYEDNFEEKLQQILDEPGIDKIKTSRIIASLCGVSVEYSDNFVNDLKRALKNNDITSPIINRIADCPIECIETQGKTFCEATCSFDAILVDKTNHLVTINETKCISCGFCIEACPNKVLMDRSEFIPLIKHLNKRSC